MFYPRPYLSASQLATFKKSKKDYFKTYLLGEFYGNKYTEFGQWVHAELEKPESTEIIEIVRTAIPHYTDRELDILTNLDGVPLKGYIDLVNKEQGIIADIKTSKNEFTQKKADTLEQITFYNVLAELYLGWTPKKNYIHWLETAEDENGQLYLTGHSKTIETKRTKKQIDDLKKEIPLIWQQIGEACDKELDKIINNTI